MINRPLEEKSGEIGSDSETKEREEKHSDAFISTLSLDSEICHFRVQKLENSQLSLDWQI
jgi:hypothetical protein